MAGKTTRRRKPREEKLPDYLTPDRQGRTPMDSLWQRGYHLAPVQSDAAEETERD